MSDNAEKYNCRNFDDCKGVIVFTERDKDYYIQRGFVNPDGSISKPRYCKPCRVKRKSQKAKYEN